MEKGNKDSTETREVDFFGFMQLLGVGCGEMSSLKFDFDVHPPGGEMLFVQIGGAECLALPKIVVCASPEAFKRLEYIEGSPLVEVGTRRLGVR